MVLGTISVRCRWIAFRQLNKIRTDLFTTFMNTACLPYEAYFKLSCALLDKTLQVRYNNLTNCFPNHRFGQFGEHCPTERQNASSFCSRLRRFSVHRTDFPFRITSRTVSRIIDSDSSENIVRLKGKMSLPFCSRLRRFPVPHTGFLMESTESLK